MTRRKEHLKTFKSSGNICADLGFLEPNVEQVKAQLARAISAIIEANGWTQADAAQRMGIDQPKVSAISRGRLEGFSIERLMRLLSSLDYVVEVTVRPAEHNTNAGVAVS